MEEFKNKTFLLKIRSDLFEYLSSQNKHEKVGKLKIFLSKKTNRPECIFHFNKENGIKNFSLKYDKVDNFIYFEDKDSKDNTKISSVDNFGNLLIAEEDEADEFVKGIYAKENDKSREIQIKQVEEREEKKYKQEEIKLSGRPNRDKKEKKVRIDDDELTEYIKKEVRGNQNITPMIISDKYNVPEDQVKTIMEKICNKKPGKKKRFIYELKEDEEIKYE